MMDLFYHRFFQTAWLAFWACWFVLARRVRKNKKAEPELERIIHVGLFWFGFALIALPLFHYGVLGWKVLPGGYVQFWFGAGILLVGLGFAVWARLQIGAYWSGNVTLKECHRLIRTGPYALVRHPIYTGILSAFLGTAVALGEVRGFVAFVLLTVLHLFKSRKEERFMEQEFGEEYVQYRKEVPALVPFVF